jgi:DNA-binding transcriptional MerR regulator
MLGLPGATLRSWDKRGLVPTDPALAGRHRHFWALDVFYVGLLKEFLAGGLRAETAARAAAAVIYGDSDTDLRRAVRSPTPERVRACQRDVREAWLDVQHRDETAPYWVVYSTTEAVPVAVLPWPEVSRHVQDRRHFRAVNLTRLLAAIERSLADLSSKRTGSR